MLHAILMYVIFLFLLIVTRSNRGVLISYMLLSFCANATSYANGNNTNISISIDPVKITRGQLAKRARTRITFEFKSAKTD